MKIWTAKDLLYATLEFKAMVPNSNHWNENSLNYNKPRLIRLRRLNVLLNAFELTRSSKQKASIWSLVEGKAKIKESELIKNEITPFLNGDFIIKRQSTDYPKLKKFIEE